jgi:hypothetical protein
MTGNTHMHMLVTDTFKKKGRGVDQKTSHYLVWPPFASCSATQLLHIELIRLLIVVCRMLSHSSSITVRSCWIFSGTGTRCRTRRRRASQTCPMGEMSEYAGHGRTGTFSASRNCVQILATLGCALSCWNMIWWRQMNGTKMGLRISSRYLCFQIAIDKMQLYSLCLPILKPLHHHWAHCSQSWHRQITHPHDAIHVVYSCEASWTYCQFL